MSPRIRHQPGPWRAAERVRVPVRGVRAGVSVRGACAGDPAGREGGRRPDLAL